MKEIKSYNQAVEELESILQQMEGSSEVDMDAISKKVKRASELMRFCKKRLHELDEELESIMSDGGED